MNLEIVLHALGMLLHWETIVVVVISSGIMLLATLVPVIIPFFGFILMPFVYSFSIIYFVFALVPILLNIKCPGVGGLCSVDFLLPIQLLFNDTMYMLSLIGICTLCILIVMIIPIIGGMISLSFIVCSAIALNAVEGILRTYNPFFSQSNIEFIPDFLTAALIIIISVGIHYLALFISTASMASSEVKEEYMMMYGTFISTIFSYFPIILYCSWITYTTWGF